MRKKIISFCITCKNRFFQIKKTLPRNLKDNSGYKSIVEFVLVDFDSQDGLKEWVLTRFRKELRQQYLRYYHTTEMPYWHASIAKNTAHLYASGEVLVNLDGDNYTGRNGGYFLLNCFNKYRYPVIIHQFSGNYKDGSFGRIALRRDDFYRIGGYNEAFAPMGYQDADLILRSIYGSGLQYIRIRNARFNRAISNTKEAGIRYCNSHSSYLEMERSNRNLSAKNIAGGILVANRGVFGLYKKVHNYKGEEVNF